MRSLKDQLRQGFNISVAEMDEAVTWQSATIGIVALSRSRDYLHGLVEEVERAAHVLEQEANGEEIKKHAESAADAVVDGEEDRGEGGDGEQGLFGEGGHG